MYDIGFITSYRNSLTHWNTVDYSILRLHTGVTVTLNRDGIFKLMSYLSSMHLHFQTSAEILLSNLLLVGQLVPCYICSIFSTTAVTYKMQLRFLRTNTSVQIYLNSVQ
jgi:hypothetical protein